MEFLPRNAITTEPFRFPRVARVPLRVTIRRNISAKTPLVLRYVPHKLLLSKDCIDVWLGHYKDYNSGLENLAVQLVDDLNNEVVPYWISVEIHDEKNNLEIFAEDCQPTWRGKTQILPEISQRSFSRLARR